MLNAIEFVMRRNVAALPCLCKRTCHAQISRAIVILFPVFSICRPFITVVPTVIAAHAPRGAHSRFIVGTFLVPPTIGALCLRFGYGCRK